MQKLVSVIIPTYSRPDFIIRAIDSVLSQTYNPIELIVVDDNGLGTEFQIATEKLLHPYIEKGVIIYLPHDVNKNGSAARNTGARACSGKYVTFLDDDDELHPDKIKRQVEAIESSNGEFHGAYCGVIKKTSSRVLSRAIPNKSGNLQRELLAQEWGFVTGSNPLFCREVFDNVGFFDESFKRKQDIEMMVRFFRKYKIVAVPEILLTKNVDSIVHRPNPDAYCSITEKFLSTYSCDIDKFTKEEANYIRFKHWFLNAQLAFNASYYSTGWSLAKKANSYKKLSFKNWLQLLKQVIVKKEMR